MWHCRLGTPPRSVGWDWESGHVELREYLRGSVVVIVPMLKVQEGNLASFVPDSTCSLSFLVWSCQLVFSGMAALDVESWGGPLAPVPIATRSSATP